MKISTEQTTFSRADHGEVTHTGVKAWEQRRRGRNCHPRQGETSPGECCACTTGHAISSIPQPHVRADVSHPHSRGKWHQWGARAHVKHMAMCAYSTGWQQMRSKHSSTEQLARLAIRTYQLVDVLFVPAAETTPQAEIVQTLALAVETITGVRPR